MSQIAAPPTRPGRSRIAQRPQPRELATPGHEPPGTSGAPTSSATADAVDVDSLINSWRLAFEAADAALRAGRHDLPAAEHRVRTQRLAEERARAVRALDGLARERHMKHFLIRVVASPRDAQCLLGLPADAVACVFNVDGILVASAAIHAEAWRVTFDEFITTRVEYTGIPFVSFSIAVDYPRLIHGRSRLASVQAFLASRGISLPTGSPTDEAGTATLNGLANRKQQVLLERLARQGVDAYEGARLYLELARDAKMRSAVVSGSTNTRTLLERARLMTLIDACVDGNMARTEGLARKPAPDMLFAACRQLGVEPGHTVVFETTPAGVDAGRAGGFEFVVAVDREGAAQTLRAHGADLVVPDLGELLEQQLAAPYDGLRGRSAAEQRGRHRAGSVDR
jgi:HAD superfamily hydrolase (TIGR01509 family)